MYLHIFSIFENCIHFISVYFILDTETSLCFVDSIVCVLNNFLYAVFKM